MRALGHLALLLVCGAAFAPDAGPPAVSEGAEAGGRHWRLTTPHGPVHVWSPPGFQAATAGTVVYVHGYFTDVDQAWAEHRLAAQFRDTALNALFIVPEAPASGLEDVSWKDLGALLEAVASATAQAPRTGPLVAVGHSGGWRTIVTWLEFKPLSQILLVDGLYANDDEFKAWLDIVRERPGNKLILVGNETSARSEQFLRELPAARLERIPEHHTRVSPAERHAQVLYMESQYGHMELVTDGRVLPFLLHLTSLRPVDPR